MLSRANMAPATLDAARATRGLSAAAQQHRARRIALLSLDPGLRSLYGAHARTLSWICGLTCLHIVTSWALCDAPIYIVFLVALGFGQFVLHAGGALVHEAAHGLILRGRRGRLFVDLLLETLLTSFGHHAQYQLDHVRSHHPYLGDYERDYEHKDACRFRARALIRRERPALHRGLIALHLGLDALPFGFLFSDDLVAAIEQRAVDVPTRDRHRDGPGPKLRRSRRIACSAVSLSMLAAIGLALSPTSLLYWLWSLSIFQGRWAVSNVGQVLAEHPTSDPALPTCSYYGPWNLVLFNTGYHDEHHTFPDVAWNALPRLRSRVPQAFQHESPHGYFALWFGYLFRGTARRQSAVLQDPGSRCDSITEPQRVGA